jgi:hypothetical protein
MMIRRFSLFLIGICITYWSNSPICSAQTFFLTLKNFETVENQFKQLNQSQENEIFQLRSLLFILSYDSKAFTEDSTLREFTSHTNRLIAELEQFKRNNHQLEQVVQQLRECIANFPENAKLPVASENQSATETSAIGEIKPLGLKMTNIISPERAANPLTNEIESSTPKLQISGFGDYYSAIGRSTTQGIGQLEVDVATKLGDKIKIDAAIAYAEDNFRPTWFTIDFPILGNNENHFYPSQTFEHAGLIAGRFDVPFGVDWKVYPSIARKLISVPLVIEDTHGAWNDFGIQFYAESKWFSAVVFGTNGFGYEKMTPENEPFEVEMNAATGGRVGVKFQESLQIGGSIAQFYNKKNALDMQLTGVDLQYSLQKFSITGEYIVHQFSLADDNIVRNTGFYAQGLYDWGKYFLVIRQDLFSPHKQDEEQLVRTSFGGGWVILEGCQLRLEHQTSQDHDNVTYMQVVVGF